MDIVALRMEHIPTLYTIYREATEYAAHCRLLPSMARFAANLLMPQMSEMQLLVAEENGTAHGCAAYLPLPQQEGHPREATVSALFVDDEGAGQALLADCLRRADADGVGTLHGFAPDHLRCPITAYNVGWGGLSDTLPMVARLLARNGFAPYHRELHLTCDMRRFPPVVPSPPPGVTTEAHSIDEWGMKLAALLDGAGVGGCEYSTLANAVDDPDAARVGYIWGIGTDEGARRRGIARHLLSRALVHLQELGCDEVWLTTSAENWPAQPLYLALGFEVVDSSVSFSRPLGSPQSHGGTEGTENDNTGKHIYPARQS